MRLNSTFRRYLLGAGAIALACLSAALFADGILDFGTHVSPLWPPAGIALAVLILYGHKHWVGVAIGMLVYNLLALPGSPRSGPVPVELVAMAMAGSQTLGAIVGNRLFHRLHLCPSLRTARDVLGFITVAVILSPVVHASISTFITCFSGMTNWQEFGVRWGTIWLGDGIGILVMTPLLLTWLNNACPGRLGLRSLPGACKHNPILRQRILEIVIWLSLLSGMSWFVFLSPSQAEIAHYPLEYLPFPFIVWAALRLGQRGTVLGSLIVSSVAILGAVEQRGPFLAKTHGDLWHAVFLLQTFVGIMTATALLVAAVVVEREQAEERLRQSEERLRGMFECAAIGIGLDDLQGRIVESNPALQRMLGYSRAELHNLTFADFTHPDDLAVDAELFQAMISGQRDYYQLEKRHIRKDGETIWVHLTNSLVRDQDGTPKFTIGMAEDITELKRAEESIQLYANIVKNMQIGLIVWQQEDLNDLSSFRLVNINPAARQILRLPDDAEQLVGERLEKVFPNLMESAFPGIYASVVRAGKVRDLGEVRYGDAIVPDGIYAMKAFPLPHNCLGLVFENITERKQAEEALQQSEARFRVIAETAACAVLVYQGPRLRYANPATEQITGYSRKELLAMDFWDLAHPDYRDLVYQRGLARQRGEPVPSRYEIKILTKQGTERWVDFTAGVISFEGKPAGLATAYDISDRKQAEAKLLMVADRERLFSEIGSRIRRSLDVEEILQTTVQEVRKFLQADRVFISCFDEDLRCQAVAESVDPQWKSILGWEISGQEVAEIRALFEPNRLRIVNDTAAMTKTPFLTEYYQRAQVKAGMGIALRLDGSMFGVLIANQCSAPRRWQPFEIDLLEQLATAVEIAIQQGQLYCRVQNLAANLERQVEERTAELQQRMQELQNTSQVKDLLLHAVSHDLRTPVQGMLMVLNRLRGKCNDCETVTVSRSMLDRMIQSSDDQLQLLNALRDKQSQDEPNISLEYKPTHLTTILNTTLDGLEPLLLQNQVTVQNQFATNLPIIQADPNCLQQVFENLLMNVIEHNLPGVTITLKAIVVAPPETDADATTEQSPNASNLVDECSLRSPVIYCSVEDTGVGMEQQQCDRLFQPYVRSLDNRRRTGIGLGLHRCRLIITAHGGQIGVSSEPDVGSKFWFTLPLKRILP